MKKNYPKEVIIRLFENQNEITDLGIYSISFLEEMAKDIREKFNVDCKFCDSAEEVPDPRELSSEKKNLMVFADLLLEKQIICESYYVGGRHSNVYCFYLAQKLFQTPTSDNQREHEFNLSFSPTPEEL